MQGWATEPCPIGDGTAEPIVEPIFPGVADTAMSRDRRARDGNEPVSKMRLRHRGGARRVGQIGILSIAGIPHQSAGRLDFECHLRQLVLQRLEATDSDTELRALLGIGYRQVKAMLCATQRIGRGKYKRRIE